MTPDETDDGPEAGSLMQAWHHLDSGQSKVVEPERAVVIKKEVISTSRPSV